MIVGGSVVLIRFSLVCFRIQSFLLGLLVVIRVSLILIRLSLILIRFSLVLIRFSLAPNRVSLAPNRVSLDLIRFSLVSVPDDDSSCSKLVPPACRHRGDGLHGPRHP